MLSGQPKNADVYDKIEFFLCDADRSGRTGIKNCGRSRNGGETIISVLSPSMGQYREGLWILRDESRASSGAGENGYSISGETLVRDGVIYQLSQRPSFSPSFRSERLTGRFELFPATRFSEKLERSYCQSEKSYLSQVSARDSPVLSRKPYF